MNRRTVAIAILAAWLASLGWLLVRGRNARETTPGGAQVQRLAPEATYYTLWMGETPVGAATLTLDTTTVGYTLLESAVLRLDEAAGRREESRTTRRGVYGRTFRLEAMDVSGSDGPNPVPFRLEVLPDGTGQIRGEARDLRASLTLPAGGLTTEPALPLHLASRRALETGRADSLALLDPGTTAWDPGRVVVSGDSAILVSDSASLRPDGRWEAVAPQSFPAWQLEWISEHEPPVRFWVTDRGRILQREPAFGLRQEAAPYEVSYRNLRPAGDHAAPDPGLTGARWLATRASAPAATTPVRVVLRRWDGPAWPGSVASLAGGRQTIVGDTLTIAEAPVAGSRPAPAPTDYVSDLYPGERRMLEGMLADALAGQGAPTDTIAALVRYIGMTRSRGGAAAIREFVALAQLAGYLARPVYGVETREAGLPGHRWAEVWRGGWEAVDPLRGQVPASTTLLRLGSGLLPGPVELVARFGGLRLREHP